MGKHHSRLERWWAAERRMWHLLTSATARRRSAGARKGAQTRKRRTMAVKVTEPANTASIPRIEKNEEEQT